MYGGIIQGMGTVHSVLQDGPVMRVGIFLPENLGHNLEGGQSIAVDGVCLTLSSYEVMDDRTLSYFDIIAETLEKTTLGQLALGRKVNMERSLKLGDEIGGHALSGHVWGKGKIVRFDPVDGCDRNKIVGIAGPANWVKYLFPKGFIAIDGASLTLVDVQVVGEASYFTIHLIPETLERTVFQFKKLGDSVNIEFDSQTQAIVTTVERYMENQFKERT